MTYVEEFQPAVDEGNAGPRGYFEAYGVEFTSTILGGVLLVFGILCAGLLWWFKAKPAWDTTATLEQSLQEKQATLSQLQNSDAQRQIAELEVELATEKRIATEILNAYGQDKQVKTFLLDLNRILTANSIQLVNYTPTTPNPVFIEDTSYGEAAQNKLKRQTFNVEFADMTYPQVEAMLASLDRMQPLVVLNDFSSVTNERPTYLFQQGRLIPQGPTRLQVNFSVDALIAPTAEELAARAQPAPEG